MNDTYVILLVAVVVCGLLLWLLMPAKRNRQEANTVPGTDAMHAFPATRHYAYFPQIRQALSREDADYLQKNAPPKAARQALRERRSVARRFLRGLHQDFSALAKMGRVIAALSPQVSHAQETERLMLSLKFQILYALVQVRLSAGPLPVHQLEVLTGLVGRLAARMDEAMARVNALSAGHITGKISA